MPYRDHPVFDQPDDDGHVVWRYLDSTQFISVLQNRGLWFTRTDKFKDPFEGIFPQERFIEEYIRGKINERIGKFMVENFEPAIESKTWFDELQFGLQEMFRKLSYMNCWHMNEYESMAMWQSNVTAGDGVLIKSTYNKLKSAVDIHGDYVFRLGVVDYVPYFEEGVEEQMDVRVRRNYLYPLMKKQIEYEHEKEVRIVVSGNESNVTEDVGFFVKTDLSSLIDEIIISPTAPPWCTPEYWRNVCRKYRVHPEISTSDLEITPEKIIEEADAEISQTVEESFTEWKQNQDWIN